MVHFMKEMREKAIIPLYMMALLSPKNSTESQDERHRLPNNRANISLLYYHILK